MEQKRVGQILRERRQTRGVSLEEAAAATRIRPIFLRAMEEDDYHLLPDERYLIRFLGEYATFLGLNPEEVQRQFSRQIARPQSSLAVFPVKRSITLSVRHLLPGLLLLFFLLPSIFIGLSLLSNKAQEATGPEAARPIREAQPLPSSDLAAPQAPTPSQGQRYILRARAQEMTWMLVTIDGGEIRDVLLRAGETWEWRAQQGFLVTLGNAGGVELVLNGRALSKLGKSGQVIRNLRLPPPEVPEPSQ
jgi:hypothetical protein